MKNRIDAFFESLEHQKMLRESAPKVVRPGSPQGDAR
jgi:hypothetical protein